MSDNGAPMGETDYNQYDHQTSYLFAPAAVGDTAPLRPLKRRKISKQHEKAPNLPGRSQIVFPTLLSGNESAASAHLRHRLFEDSWALIDEKIQSILHDVNEGTLGNVTKFINEVSAAGYGTRIPTGLIVTGPNIASQELLFIQLVGRLRSDGYAPVVLLRSSDAPNLKTLLKKLIRDATNQRGGDDDDARIMQTNGNTLLNYDLQILHDHLRISKNEHVVVAFQDSEAFDSSIISDALLLFNSWRDRIPIVVLLGIATSVELFQERLPRTVTRCIDGVQFDVEQTSKTLERVFQKVVAGSNIPLLLGPTFVAALLERQHDHVQSLRSFISALKYAYMCHFYANPLSILLDLNTILEGLQPEIMEAIRMLPSFRKRVKTLLDHRKFGDARDLLESDEDLLGEVRRALESREEMVTTLRRNMHLLAVLCSQDSTPVDRIELYVKTFSGELESDLLKEALESIKTLSPQEVVLLMKKLSQEIASGDPESNLEGWGEYAQPFQKEVFRMQSAVERLLDDANKAGTPLRSRHASQSKAVRATVVAQKVQLSREKSSLSELDRSYSNILDELSALLKHQLRFENPLDLFLNEIWLYDSKSPHREVFSPKPRYATERALSIPHDYLGCTCCRASEEGLSSSQPPTAIIYQLYQETGGLINIFDLWSAFYAIIGGDDGSDYDEKLAFALFYRALADLKLLGVVKQSRRKTDHLAKLAWKGL